MDYDKTEADLRLFALRMMRGAHKRRQDRRPGSAWDCLLERWIAVVPPA